MILFTGRSIHFTKIPNMPVSQGYMFFCIAEKSNVREFQPSSIAVGADPVYVEFPLLQLTDTGKMVYHLIRCSHQRNQQLTFNVYMDNFFTTQPLLAELLGMGINACGPCKQQCR